jgi:hypothetical protein
MPSSPAMKWARPLPERDSPCRFVLVERMPLTAGLKTDSHTARAAERVSPFTAWLPLLTFPLIAIVIRNRLPAWLFMWVLAFTIFWGLKWATWWRARNGAEHHTGRSLAYLFAWPGMDAEAFLDPDKQVQSPRSRDWMWASLKTLLGVVLMWGIARRVPAQLPLSRGWIGLFGLIFLLHFGSFHLIALFWQSRGIDAQPIMSRPLLSKTLSEFWGKRWNLGFRQLAYELIFRPLHKQIGAAAAGLLVFFVSGLIHDLVISVPARGGYGLPTAYFLVQGLAVTLERSRLGEKLNLQNGLPAWIFMFVVAAGPVFWLFHPPFVMRVILPFIRAIRAL